MERNRFHLCVLVSFLLCWTATAQAGGISVASVCNPVAQNACGLPFPSDLFRNLGGTYNFSNKILDLTINGPTHAWWKVAPQFPAGFRPARIFNNSDGFSPLGPVLFELKNFPTQDIPADGAGTLLVFDMDTNEQIPMVVSLSKVANPKRDFRESRPVIIAWPKTRFQFGKRYVAVLLKAPFDTAAGDSTTFVPSPGMQKVLDGKANYFLQSAYKPALAVMARNNIDRSNILSLTFFTVRTEDEVVGPMQKMIQQALSFPTVVNQLQPDSTTLGDPNYELLTLKGMLSLVNFRSADGGIYPPFDPLPNTAFDQQTDFVLTLPKADGSGPIPISIWGHGLGNAKEVTKSGFIMGDRLGMATIAIDHPNHGTRISLQEPYIGTAVQSPSTIMQLLGMFVQGVVDQCVVANDVENALPRAVANWHNAQYPNVPTLDGSRIIFDGMSLGAMLGTTIGAVCPNLKGAYLVNGTGSLMQIITESTFWDGMTSHVIPVSANGAELTFMVAMMQQYLDIADGNNFVQFYRNPPAGQDVHPMGMHYSIGDGSVPNAASRATAIMADLPLLKTVIQKEPDLRDGDVGLDDFEDGFGIVQSGYGLPEANQAIATIKQFDPTILAGLGLDQTNILSQLSGMDFGNGLSGQTVTQILNSLGITTGSSNAANLNNLVDLLYQGDMQSFLTHFNRGDANAVTRSTQWRCEVLDLSQSRCSTAIKLAVQDANNQSNNPLDILTGGNSSTTDQINNLIQQGLSKVKVTDKSAGSIDVLFLLGALILLVRIVILRNARQPVPVRRHWRR